MSLNHEKLQWTEWGPICSHSYFKYLSIYLDSPSAADQDEADEKGKQRIQASGRGGTWGRFSQTFLIGFKSCFLHISREESACEYLSQNLKEIICILHR